jgi:hypothetical protein
MRYAELFERHNKNLNLAAIISAARKAKSSLSTDAAIAVEAWQSTNWDSGKLEMAFRENGPLAKEITEAFAPVLEVIRNVCGSTITLYRGQRKYEQHELTTNRVLFSWTGDEKVASHFLYAHKPYKEITDAEINAAIQQYKKNGFCKFAEYSIKKSADNEGFYNMYKGREFIGDGYEDEMLADFQERQSDRRESNEENKPQGELVVREVPVELIVWVTNDLNSKEFIVKLNPLK